MKFLANLKSKLDDYYIKHPSITGYITRFVLSFLALIMMRANIGYNEILTNFFFVLFFAVVCSFLPAKFMTLALVAYAIVQLFSLTSGIGILACILFVIMYLIYFRFDEKTGYVIIIIPLLCMAKLPFLAPAVLAVVSSTASVISTVLGFAVYYFIHYIQMNTAVFMGVSDNSEIVKMSMMLSGLFSYREMWFTIICVVIAFLTTYYLKKININRSGHMAVSIGTGIFLILILISNLVCESMNYSKLMWLVAGSVATCILGMVVTDLILPLDYSRTELMEFEDDEYKYYVRAVPKASVMKESVKIKRIYSRKKTDKKDSSDILRKLEDIK